MKETLTSKERVRRAFAYQEPDRVPLNYFANPEIDRRLKRHFGVQEHDDEGLRQALKIDFRSVNPPYIGRPLHAEVPERVVNLWGIHMRWIEHGEGGYWDYCVFLLKDADLEAILNWPRRNSIRSTGLTPAGQELETSSTTPPCCVIWNRCWWIY